MRYITTCERLAWEEGWKEGWIDSWKEGWQAGRHEGARSEILSLVEFGLRLRFGEAGVLLVDQIRSIKDLQRLRAIDFLLWTCQEVQDIRKLIAE